MNWKDALHKDKNTKLICIYHYERIEGVLFEHLEKQLQSFSIPYPELSIEEKKKLYKSNANSQFKEMFELLSSIINIIKSNNCTIDEIRKSISDAYHQKEVELTLNLVEPLYEAYQIKMNSLKLLDFSDLINNAIEAIDSKLYENPYKLIIVDEYQDISRVRFELLKSLRRSNDFNIFCVGDDWQSIYRFAGSNVDYITKFEKYWGISQMSRITNTYRFPQRIADISKGFITKNSTQLEKTVNSMGEKYKKKVLEELLVIKKNDIEKKVYEAIKTVDEGKSVLLLGRYNKDFFVKENSYYFDIIKNNNDIIELQHKERKDLIIKYLTVHKSKGLEADVVFILNNSTKTPSFPSTKIENHTINLLLSNGDTFPFAEERRLYYVALTRTKSKVFLVVVKGEESVFFKELKKEYQNDFDSDEARVCKECGAKLILRKGKYGDFYGCSKFYKTGCTYKESVLPHPDESK